MRKTILVVYPIPEAALQPLQADFELIYPHHGQAFTRNEQLQHLPQCHGMLSVFNQPVDATLMDAAPNLRIIANYGVGYNNIDTKAATERQIIVTNTPHAVAEPTAELALTLMLALSRRVGQFQHLLRSGTYTQWNMMAHLGQSVHGRKLGIVGLGRIGKLMAQKAQALGLQVSYHNRSPLSPTDETSLNVSYLAFDHLLAQSDYISLHLPLNAQTHHLINAQALQQMQPHAMLINTARGAVVDEKALLHALQQSQIAGAALDVFEHEPQITDGLLQLPNVLAVPHIGTQTTECRLQMGQEAVANLLAFFRGQTLPSRVA